MPDDASLSSREPGREPGREPWREAVIEEVTTLTPTVKAFRLRPSHWQPFLAGQHVDVRLTAPDGYTAQRSYSVTSSPRDEGILELAIERLDDGEVSPYFHDVAAPGDIVELRGPFATHFAWHPAVGERVLLVAGGSGVAPFVSMVRLRGALSSPPPMTLLYSARTWGDVIYRDELLAHARDQQELHLALAITRERPPRAGDYGRRVDSAMLEETLRHGAEPALVFVCGRNAFVEAVASTLVSLGVAAGRIRTERYGGA